MAQCSRSSCTKQLRKDNAKGVCSSNCESPDAPNGVRAKGVDTDVRFSGSAAAPKVDLADKHNASEVMAKFRAVTDALGLDAEVILAEAAQGWLDAVRETIQAADSDKE